MYEFFTEEYKEGSKEGISSFLMEKRIVFLSKPVTDQSAQEIITLLLWLDSCSHDPINLFINSPGGSVSAGFGIIDCMHGILSPVHTHAFGMAASMAAVILANGAIGNRSVSSNAEVLIHQPLMGNLQGQASDIEITAKSLVRTKEVLCRNLAMSTGKTFDEVERSIDRDKHLNAEEAVSFGIADLVKSTWDF